MSTAQDPQIAQALRAAAIRAAECAEGAIALAFVAGGQTAHDLRLRAAAGFDSPEAARDVAQQAMARVRDALPGLDPVERSASDLLGDRGISVLLVQPIVHAGHTHGALALGTRATASERERAIVSELADGLAVRLDHDRLSRELAELSGRLAERRAVEEEKSEEVLKLSEALFAQDIELLRNNEKLGKIEQLKNDFIEKMSCELRTPLNSIIEAIISVLTGENDSLSETAKSALRCALDDGTAFLRTLQNILDLWKIKQGELPLEIQDVNLREVVDEAIFSIQDTIGSKPLTVAPHIPESFPRIRTDLAKLNQILFLLLDNAAKFTADGDIGIEARLEDNVLVCSIEDSGVGICADDQQFVFDEFFQVDEPSSRKYRGAGLGLTLVRDLVTLLEGDVWIRSDVGRGTTVGIRIPIQLA